MSVRAHTTKTSQHMWILLQTAILLGFIITRTWIWLSAPKDFTEIIYSYMPYAHMWDGGVTPYLEQWYEYPPATIPLFYLPHYIDKTTNGTDYHINYGNAYRLQLLIIDVAIFYCIWKVCKRLLKDGYINKNVFALNVLYYITATSVAHTFMYDTMDLSFAAALTLSASGPILWQGWSARFGLWLGFWLATALKLLNAPLLLPILLWEWMRQKPSFSPSHIFKWLAPVGVAVGIVWGLPVLLYRSALQVMFVYHSIRGLQVDSLGAIIVRFINSFTQSERVIEVYKNYEMTGPLSTEMLKILGVIFPASIGLFLLWACWRLIQSTKPQTSNTATPSSNNWILWIYVGYILLLMLSSKVLSRPFLIWHIPLFALLPHQSPKDFLKWAVPSLGLIAATYSFVPDIEIGIFRLPLFVGILRSLSFGWLFLLWMKHQRNFG